LSATLCLWLAGRLAGAKAEPGAGRGLEKVFGRHGGGPF